jgi:hypothetical protein
MVDEDGDKVQCFIIGGTIRSMCSSTLPVPLGRFCCARSRVLSHWPHAPSCSVSLSSLCCCCALADYFSNIVFLLNSTTGIITMNPNLPMFDQNLNYESRDPNPFVLRVRLLGMGHRSACHLCSVATCSRSRHRGHLRAHLVPFCSADNGLPPASTVLDFRIHVVDRVSGCVALHFVWQCVRHTVPFKPHETCSGADCPQNDVPTLWSATSLTAEGEAGYRALSVVAHLCMSLLPALCQLRPPRTHVGSCVPSWRHPLAENAPATRVLYDTEVRVHGCPGRLFLCVLSPGGVQLAEMFHWWCWHPVGVALCCWAQQVSDEDEPVRGDTAEYSIAGGDPVNNFVIDPRTGFVFFGRYVVVSSRLPCSVGFGASVARCLGMFLLLLVSFEVVESLSGVD